MENNKKLKNFIKTTIHKFLNEQNEQKEFNTDNMKELIIQALNNAFSFLERVVKYYSLSFIKEV